MGSITWKPNASGYWNVAANWSGGVVPGAGDNVTLSSASAHRIYFNTTDTVASLIGTDDLLALQGGTLVVSGALALAGGLDETGGTLSLLGAAASITGATIGDGDVLLGASTVLTLTGATSFGATNNSYGARIHGPGTLTTGGVTSIADYGGNPEAVLGGGLSWVNTGTVNDGGVVEAFYTPGTAFTLVNQAGAVYDLTSDDASIDNGTVYDNHGTSQTAASVFTNAGTLEKSGGAGGTSNIYAVLDNTGTIDVANGTLALEGGGVIGGALTGAGTLALDAGLFTLSSSPAAQTGLAIGNATVVLQGNVNVGGGVFLDGGTIDLNSGTLNVLAAKVSYGEIDGPGTLITGGMTNLEVQSNIFLGGGAEWINTGTVIDSGYYIQDEDPAGVGIILNQAGATFDFANNYGISGSGTIVNAGLLEKTSGTGLTVVQASVTNTGTIDVATGTLGFEGGGTFGGAIIGAGTLAFAGGTSTLAASAELGVTNLLVGGGTLVLGGSFNDAGNFSITAGTVELSGATFSVASPILTGGTFNGTGTLATAGTETVNNFQIGGGAEWSNAGSVNENGAIYGDDTSGAGIILNQAGATFDLTSNAGLYGGYAEIGSFLNAGLLEKTGGTGTTAIQDVVDNTGTIDITTATLSFDAGGTFGGLITGAGAVEFAAGTATLAPGNSLAAADVIVAGTLLLGTSAVEIGNFSLASGAVELDGQTLAISTAALTGGTIDGSGTLVTSGTVNARYVEIGGGAAWVNTKIINDTGYVYGDDVNGAGIILNQAGATFNLVANASIYNAFSTPGTFMNAGVLAKTSGTGTSAVEAVVQDNGTISIAAGTIEFTDGGSFAGTILGAGTVAFPGGATVNVGALAIAGTTAVVLSDSLNLTGNVSIASSFNDSVYTALNGETLSISGTDSFGPPVSTGGTSVFDDGGTVIATGTVSLADNGTYDGVTDLYITGGSEWVADNKVNDAGLIQLGSFDGAGTISNAATGVFDFTSDDAGIVNGYSYDIYGDVIPVVGTFINAGQLAKVTGTGTNTIDATLISTGTISTNAGAVVFADGGTLGGKILSASHVSLASGDFFVNGLTQGGTLTDAAQIDQTGAMTLGSGSVAGALVVSGVYNIDNDSSIVLGTTAATTITVTSAGTFGKLGGTGTSTIAAAIADNGGIFVDSGKLLLAGAVSGIGRATVANGASLEVAGSIGSSLSVTLGSSSKLLIDQLANFKAKIVDFVVGDTLDLGGQTITSAIGSNGVLTLKNGTSTVGTLALAGNHTGDVYTLGTDGAGGTLLGIVSNSSSWTGGTADWTIASDWSAGVPMADTNATIAGTSAKTITIGASENDLVKSLALANANATLAIDGTLSIGGSFAQTAGTVELAGTINGGTINVTGGDFAVAGAAATFNGVQYQGNLDLTQNDAQLQILGGAIAGPNGAGSSTLNITGLSAGLFGEGIETLNNAAIVLGNGSGPSYLEAYDPNDTGALFTLGTAVSVTQSGLYATIGDYSGNDTDGMFNSGAITGAVSGGTLAIAGNLFENDGVIRISNGDTLDIGCATFTNAGTLSISGSTLILGNTGFTNTGSFALTSSTLDVAGSFSTGQVLSLVTSGDTLDISGTLNNTGATLAVGAGTTLGTVTLAPGANIIGGTINDAGGGVDFVPDAADYQSGGQTLSSVTYQGTLSLNQFGQNLYVENGITLTGAGGSGPGYVNLTGASALQFLTSATLDNATIALGYAGPPGDAAFIGTNDSTNSALTLTLGPKLYVVDNVAQSYALFGSAYAISNDLIVNEGTIAAAAANATVFFAQDAFTNLGVMQASNGGTIDLSGAIQSFPGLTNLAGTTLTGGTYSVGTNAVIELAKGAKITTDAADIVLSGTASNIQGLSGSSQIKLDSTLATIASGGTLALLAGRNFSSTLAVTDSGQLDLGGTTFSAGGLTIASGGTLAGTGFAMNTIVDNGVIAAAAGGTLKLGGVTGAGTLLAAAGAVLEVAGTAAATDTVQFTGLGGTLAIDAAASFAATFGNLGAGDTLDFTSLASATATISGATLTVQAAGNTYHETINSLPSTVLTTTADGHGGTDITFYRQAAPSLHSPEPVAFGEVHVGASLSQALTISNLDPADGYSEALDGSIASASSLVTASGSFVLLGAGSTSTALTVSLAAGAAGVEAGTAIITLASDGTGVDGLGTTSLGTQTVNLSASVFAYATAAAIAPVNLGQAHVGGTLSQFLVLDNSAAPGAYSENLDASFSGTSLGLTGSGSVSELAGGASNGSGLLLSTSPGTAGVASGTATLALVSDGTGIDTLASTTLTPETITASGTLFNLATASAPGTLNFGQHHAGFNYTQTIVIADTAAKGAYSENLDAGFSGTSSSLSTSGTISELAAGASNSTAMIVTLHAGAGGAVTGSTTINLTSDGAGIDSLGTTALPSDTLAVTGTLFNYATASITSKTLNFGIVHVGGAVDQYVTLSNTAVKGSYSENLDASFSGTSSAFTTSGSLSRLAAGSSSSKTLEVLLNTGTAGALSATGTLKLTSDGGGIDSLGTSALAAQNITITGTVNNYATASLENLAGAGTLSGSGTTLALNLGTVAAGGTISETLGVLNSAAGPADLLSGSFVTGTSAPFTDTGFNSFASIAAGAADNTLGISLSDLSAGTYTETIVLDASGSNASGYSGTLAPETLVVTGTVTSGQQPRSLPHSDITPLATPLTPAAMAFLAPKAAMAGSGATSSGATGAEAFRTLSELGGDKPAALSVANCFFGSGRACQEPMLQAVTAAITPGLAVLPHLAATASWSPLPINERTYVHHV